MILSQVLNKINSVSLGASQHIFPPDNPSSFARFIWRAWSQDGVNNLSNSSQNSHAWTGMYVETFVGPLARAQMCTDSYRISGATEKHLFQGVPCLTQLCSKGSG